MTKPQPAVERAYDFTRSAVLEGRIAAGGWVTEGEVAEELGISRTPVREAFLHLQAEGFLRLYPRRGAMVEALTSADVDAVMELRELAELFAARKALGQGVDVVRALVADLRTLLEAQHNAGAAGDVTRFVELDRELHSAIVHAGGNDLLDQFYGSLRDKQQRLGTEALRRQPSRLETILAEHAELIETLAEGDLERHEQVLGRHLSSSRQALALR